MSLPFLYMVGDVVADQMTGEVIGRIPQRITILNADTADLNALCHAYPGVKGTMCDEDWPLGGTALAHVVIYRLDTELGVSPRVRSYWNSKDEDHVAGGVFDDA